MPYTSKANKKIYSVSSLNKEIRRLLEQEYAYLTLTGEISNFVKPASGHWYFTLKDNHAQIRAAMWRGNNRSATFLPKDGDQVLVQARLSLYEPRGDYQLIVEKIEPEGDGRLKQEFEQLKMKLAAAGLFASTAKKEIPKVINKVGVITSATGAAVKDILTVLKRRAPQLEVIIYPAQVQGNDAHQQLIDQLKQANQRREVEVILLGRGGGSLEDLWCFNNELLAYEIFNSDIPVISAVGHEIDVTISDFVADVRAATPSAAAELVSPDSRALKQHSDQLKQRLHRAIAIQLDKFRTQQQLLAQQLAQQHPKNQLQQKAQKLDELEIRLSAALNKNLQCSRQKQHQLQTRLLKRSPHLAVSNARYQLTQVTQKLTSNIQKKLDIQRNHLSLLCTRLDAISPLATLSRGYSITENSSDRILKSADDIKVGDTLITTLGSGKITSEVLSVEAEPKVKKFKRV